MPGIQKSASLRKVPTSGTLEPVATMRYQDTIIDEEVSLQQFMWSGFPLHWVKVIDSMSSGHTGPTISGVTTVANANVALAQFSTTFGFGSPIGLLLWCRQADTNQHLLRKLISSAGSNIYNLNEPLNEALANSDAYDLLVDLSRFNALYIKPEFSTSGTACDVRVKYYSINEDNDQPSGALAKPIKSVDRVYSLINSGDNTEVEESGYYHGEMIGLPVQGPIGAKIEVLNITGGGAVSIWVGTV